MEGRVTGLRERKKQQTRQRLAHLATVLFIERGFENVTIAEVAEAAGVSKMTVTNYFPLKEDLVFDAHDEVVDSLARLVRERAAGESALAAVRGGFIAALEHRQPLSGYCTRDFARLVHRSPRLTARERELDDEREARLAAALAAEHPANPDDLTASLVAAALAGAHRALFRETRRLIRGGTPMAAVTRRLAPAADRAFDLLEPSLGGYWIRPS